MKPPLDVPPEAEAIADEIKKSRIDRRTAFKRLIALNIGIPAALNLLNPNQASAQSSDILDAMNYVSQRSSSRLFQLTFLADLQQLEHERNDFLADPIEYTRARGITLDPYLIRELVDATVLFRPVTVDSPLGRAFLLEGLTGGDRLTSAYNRIQATPTANTVAVAAVAVAAVAVAGVLAYNAYTMTSHRDHFEEILRSNRHLLPSGGNFDERPDER
ncbi:hypothetical protein [Mesorhizobium sp. M7A.F.Ca.MR.362.00.0.0]|uniref:hypothetical protein n=1 Tax=Mesorhizobium sp. M7A.F.Ca.MR.362.00.0.0 TaxID=2496779 RepID=UPI000FD34DAD|nr:hypothetical protein [Mesorhizobium sp. M7A.F.Ca.MR.362.00.0.0]RUU82748.1 hypothetical protein EOC06_02860 [Mesorhizobium sp. M7A.F.Ca.MR.362.00.0.0]RWN96576.1 MAG: hypothetical protein EOS05_01125 [Mesorhizobium sp.]